MAARFGDSAATVFTAMHSVEIATTEWGRASVAPPTEGTLVGGEEHVTYAHSALTEWFVPSEAGLEHGFTIPAPPDGEGELVVDVQMTGELRPVLDRHGNVVLVDVEGRRRGHYTHLYAFDGGGAELPSWFSVREDMVRIHVDDEGAVYPVTIDPLLWGKVQTLMPSLGTAQDVGTVTTEGDRALLSAIQLTPDANGKGVVFVADRVGGVWTETDVLRPSGVYGDIDYGRASSLWGDQAAVTAWGNASTPGRVYVFERNGGTWGLFSEVTGPDTLPGDLFGASVVITQGRLFVSAPYADVGGLADAGAVYTFTRTAQGWVFEDKLVEPTPVAGATFGACLDALADQLFVAGAPTNGLGVVHEFRKPTPSFPSWNITSYTPPSPPTAPSGLFGNACAFGGSSVFVGAPDDYNFGGAVYQFYSYALVDTFFASQSGFGATLAGSPNQLAVGASNPVVATFRNDGANALGIPEWSHQQTFQFAVYSADVSDTTLVTAGAQFYQLAYENGDLCAADVECLSDHCVDGVCCDAACGGSCEACDLPQALGTCTVLAAGEAGDPACAPYVCDGAGASCPLQCGLDGDCIADHFCDGGSCAAKGALADPCTAGNGCLSGVCVDGVCCATACDGLCEACDVAGHEGGCWPVPSGEDPASECADGACNGAGVCGSDAGVACAAASDCLSGFCVDGVCCDSACDGPCETCAASGSAGSCKPIGAGDDPDDECADGVCNGVGACLLSLGVSCGYDEACLSGFCVDGVCCDAGCGDSDEGDCQACSVAAGAPSDGSCAPLAAGTVCREADAVCGGEESCDGTGVDCPTDLAAPDGMACDDEDPCTSGDACMSGVCSGEGSCGAGGDATGGGVGGAGGSGADDGGVADSGCGCRTVASPAGGQGRGWAWTLLGVAGLLRRRRRGACGPLSGAMG